MKVVNRFEGQYKMSSLKLGTLTSQDPTYTQLGTDKVLFLA